jgi:hypothetical protein
MICESCKHAIWDYFEYFGGYKQPFVYECEKEDELTAGQFREFLDGKIDECGMYVEVDDGFGN